MRASTTSTSARISTRCIFDADGVIVGSSFQVWNDEFRFAVLVAAVVVKYIDGRTAAQSGSTTYESMLSFTNMADLRSFVTKTIPIRFCSRAKSWSAWQRQA